MSYLSRLWNAILGKNYGQLVNKPTEVNRGANWASVGGVRETYSAGKSLLAYGLHGYTHAGVKRASQDLAALPIKLIRGYGERATEVMEHPVLDLIRQPSTDIDEFLFREQITSDIMLCGNCYILLLGTIDQKPISIVRLHPNEVRIVTDPKEGIIGYEHNSSGSVVIYPPNRVIHGRTASYADGAQQIYGTGAIEALSKEIDADLNAQQLASEASRKGRPDVLLSPKEDGDIWPLETRRQILDQYMGLAKQGGALVLSGQVEVSPLQLSPREMEFQASRTMARESISAVLGVPPSILGLPTANYALGRQQAIEYWSNQIKRGKRIGLLFTRIARLWDEELHFEHDYTDVEALQSVRTDKLLRIEKHIFNGVSPQLAYAAEGLEFPRKQEPRDIGREEDDNARGIDVLARLYSTEQTKDIDYGDKSNSSKAMSALPEGTQLALKRKGKEHNEEHGDNKAKRLSRVNYLATSYHRGLAAFHTNPSSVRPSVNSSSQWAMARVNSFLFALRNGRYRSGKHDTDLLPADHPMSGEEKKLNKSFSPDYDDEIQVLTIPSNANDEEEGLILDSILGNPPQWGDYKQAHLLYDENQNQLKSGYLIRIGRRYSETDPLSSTPGHGKIVVFKDLLAKAVDTLNGRYGRLPITDEERRSAYRVLQRYFDKIDMSAPELLDSYLSFDGKKKVNKDEDEITNFPAKGDNKEVSLRNSQWKVFDIKYAKNLKANYPSIWRAGGNIRGNEQYRKLLPIAERGGSKKPVNGTEERAIRLREAWNARHRGDGSQFKDPDTAITIGSVGGIVAQIKWLAVGDLGQTKMKKVINELKKKIDAKRILEYKRKKMWQQWVKSRQSGVEKQFFISFSQYLTDAKHRYAVRIENANVKNYESKAYIVDMNALVSQMDEKIELNNKMKSQWQRYWAQVGNGEYERLFSSVNQPRPEGVEYSNPSLSEEVWNDTVDLIVRTTSNAIQSIVESALSEGKSVDDIAKDLLQADTGVFSKGRARIIARTEATKLVNKATTDSWSGLSEHGISIQKEWLSARDGQVRDSHQSLDGTVVGINEDFVLSPTYGGYSAPSPASFGQASEDINCRCTVIPKIID